MKFVLNLFVIWLVAWGTLSIGIAADNGIGSTKPSEISGTSQIPMNDKAQAKVLRVDKIGGEITLEHGPLKKLDMPAMTMDFKVKDLAMLEHIKKGDKVNFVAENIDGELIVTMIEAAK